MDLAPDLQSGWVQELHGLAPFPEINRALDTLGFAGLNASNITDVRDLSLHWANLDLMQHAVSGSKTNYQWCKDE